jgi:hypothetical protein
VVQFKSVSKYILLLGFLLLAVQLRAQQADADTVKVSKKIKLPEEEHSPRKATMYSAILPGLGQAYNKKYWKIPLVYGGFYAIGYFIGWNNKNYQLYKTAYQDWTDDDLETTRYLDIEVVRLRNYDPNNSSDYANLKEALNNQQEYFRRNRDLLIISVLGFYGLNVIDAGVDAHLFNFDISDDLSFNWQPSVVNINSQNIYCINCSFNF